ncbi:probable inactive receptor kinase At2g26730 [Diospyros lotus]|uniref:probable inactive receptor kinase At2g26730 n=1 Tax=Diospyros lotus TaxID=55363 RepID=UPI002256CB2A|nr:probable inactive receptor kinase At2g26730 [Diospyros lotus]
MDRISIWVLFISVIPYIQTANSDEEEFRGSLIRFYRKLGSSYNASRRVLSSESDQAKSPGISTGQLFMFSGYFFVGLALFLVIIIRVCKRNKMKAEQAGSTDEKLVSADHGNFYKQPDICSGPSGESRTGQYQSETSAESGMASTSVIVLSSPEVNGLRFEDLLKAPAELAGRGKHGSVYKVTCDQGMTLAVKRIKNWVISSNDFKQRMTRLEQVKHPNVLAAKAFYCSIQEKLLVYEYQPNGSLSMLLKGSQTVKALDWSCRLGIAATIANTLAFMHHELLEDGIPHGNLKSSNILLNANMEPCMSEYGLMESGDGNDESRPPAVTASKRHAAFKADIYGLGVILLELLTGKSAVQNSDVDLAKWVLSVVREEWTVEVFDKSLILAGASEERMVNLLQIAVKCVNRRPEDRPAINQVALMINTIKEEEDGSMVRETASE